MRPIFTFLLATLCTALTAQFTVSGTVLDTQTEKPLAGVFISVDGANAAARTDNEGRFSLRNVPVGEQTLVFLYDDYTTLNRATSVTQDTDLGVVLLVLDPEQQELDVREEITAFTITEEQLDEDLAGQNVSSLLAASRDVFLNVAAFNFNAARYRVRGYDFENTRILLNGIEMNELESGRVFWGQWGGLNDVLRSRTTDVGLATSDLTFGDIGGVQSIDLRASKQWKQTRASYARSNRSYTDRIMVTHSTGMMPNGWAFSVSGSRRWAEEGYIEGTPYDAWSYYAAADKQTGDNHLTSLAILGAPIERGRSGGSTQEFYDLAGSVYYNPNWGFQEGEKRNSRIFRQHQPIIFLNHEWTIAEGTSLRLGSSYQFGRSGTTALDWFNAPDPRPDYYRNGPQFLSLTSPREAQLLASRLRYNDDLLQINWARLYDANRNSPVQYNDTPGQWSQYILEERRFDSRELNLNAIYEQDVSEQLHLTAGVSYQKYRGENFKVVEDLLGGDYYVNLDKFANFDGRLNEDAVQLDLRNPDRILREGDRWGYDYESDISKYHGWVQAEFSLPKFDFFLSGNVSQTEFFRTGNYQSGRFPDNSFGRGTPSEFTNYGVKGGATWKINGRNYAYASALHQTRAPFFRNAYTFPRLNDDRVQGLTSETIQSFEAGYILRYTGLKARATAFYTTFDDQIETRNVFISGLANRFGNYVLSGVSKEHLGIEVAAEVKLNAALTLQGGAAIGDYKYTSRPRAQLFLDSQFDSNESDLQNSIDRGTVFIDNFKIGGQPLTAYNVGLRYNSPQYWFANLNFNFFDRMYLPFSPERRLARETFGLDPDSEVFRRIVDQQRLPAANTVDVFGGKSFRLESDLFLSFTIGVNNLFDNRFISGGFENYRFDRPAFEETGVEVFEPRYFYAFGTNFFVMATLRMR